MKELLLNNYLDKLGVSVTIKVRSTTVNDYGDVTDDYTDHTTTAIIEYTNLNNGESKLEGQATFVTNHTIRLNNLISSPLLFSETVS